MGKKSAPPPPDYRGAAEEQSAASEKIALGQTYADRPDIISPFGRQTWAPRTFTDPSTGKKVTRWDQEITLDPEMQASLDAQQRLNLGRTNAAEDLLGQAVSGFEQPFDWDSLPSRSGSVSAGRMSNIGDIDADVVNKAFSFGSPTEVRQRAQDAVSQLQAPMLRERREDTENQLVNMGHARGSKAFNREMRGVSDAEARADLMAIAAGRDEAGQMFQQGMASDQFENAAQQQEFENLMRRAQAGDSQAQQALAMQMQAGTFNNQLRSGAISEEQLRRTQSLNELNALLTGQQVGSPDFGGAGAPGSRGGTAADYLGAAQAQGQAEMGEWSARQAQNSANMGTAASLAMLAYMWSDARLKEDIRTIGFVNGIRVVSFRFKGFINRTIGVIAQQVAAVRPEAVRVGYGGFLMVDYSKVF